MKKIFCLLFLFCALSTAGAQELKQIDDCSMLFIYNYQICEEHKNPVSVKNFEMVLEVGKLYSKFYDPNLGSLDSTTVAFTNQPPLPGVTHWSTTHAPVHAFCIYYIFKNYPSSGITTFLSNLAFGDAYRVEEKLEFNWKIDNNATGVVLGMKCKRATCRYAGRDYEAWFAPEIPISNGPYKFGGLPGLIVKLQDSGNEHVFELREIKKVNKPMYMYTSSRTYTKISAKGYAKALKMNQISLIEAFDSGGGDPEVVRKATARIKKQNNFIERY